MAGGDDDGAAGRSGLRGRAGRAGVSTANGGAPREPTEEDGPDLEFLEKVLPFFRRMRDYTRLKADGLDHVPTEGPALLVGNHTGWLGLDYALTALSVHEAHGRLVRGMAHDAWFRTKAVRDFARKVGLVRVTKDAIREQVEDGQIVLMFPEGEKGAFRPGSDYTLEEFARGFVRVALETGVPVVPVAILGGEESNPVGRRIEGYEDLLRIRGGLPIPKNLIPKPVKWRIRFLPPLDLSEHGPGAMEDRERVHAIADSTRATIQHELRKMKVERGHPYL